MSGYSEGQNCPKCKTLKSFEYNSDEEGESGECHECGYYFSTEKVEGRMTLEEVNVARLEMDEERIKKLKDWR